jgi:hypothetical protein
MQNPRAMLQSKTRGSKVLRNARNVQQQTAGDFGLFHLEVLMATAASTRLCSLTMQRAVRPELRMTAVDP